MGLRVEQIPSAERDACSAGLRWVDDARPGMRRQRCGKGFLHVTTAGKPVADREVLDRIKALAIPPAWTRVWICDRADGHIQASGFDARGRKQYRYHAEWRRTRDAHIGRLEQADHGGDHRLALEPGPAQIAIHLRAQLR